MAREYVSSDGGIVNDTGVRTYVSSDGGVVNETSGGGGGGGTTTINALVGNAVADGLTAGIVTAGTTTITATVGNATAAGNNALVDTKIVTAALMNNTESIHASQAVVWSWFPAGRIGALAAVAAADGTGTTGADGRLVTTISRAAGILMVAKQNAGATTDDVYYEAF